MWDDSPEVDNWEGIIGLHVRNQVNLNGRNIWVGDKSFVDIAYIVHVTTGLYSKYLKIAGVKIKKYLCYYHVW